MWLTQAVPPTPQGGIASLYHPQGYEVVMEFPQEQQTGLGWILKPVCWGELQPLNCQVPPFHRTEKQSSEKYTGRHSANKRPTSKVWKAIAASQSLCKETHPQPPCRAMGLLATYPAANRMRATHLDVPKLGICTCVGRCTYSTVTASGIKGRAKVSTIPPV